MKLLAAAAVALALTATTAAPFQCASDPDPNRRREDTAPEALWQLSEHFRERGDVDARLETLRVLRERYPRSRYARRAEPILAGAEPDEEAP